MVSLICDSATKVLYMALVIDDKVKEERYYDDGKNHSVNIVAGIYEMLVKNHIKPLEVDKFICGIGPGSYTGVRMAVTVAKMFGAFSKTKIYQISTLSLMASKQEGKVLCYIDARNGNVFGGVYLNGKALYVDSFFQSAGIGNELIGFAIKELHANNLWALEKNVRAISFYQRQGFHLTGQKKFEEDTTEYLIKLER